MTYMEFGFNLKNQGMARQRTPAACMTQQLRAGELGNSGSEREIF
jgi:hypothetical protein